MKKLPLPQLHHARTISTQTMDHIQQPSLKLSHIRSLAIYLGLLSAKTMIPGLLLLLQLVLLIEPSAAAVAKQGCRYKCGEVEIPYPFGIGSDCFLPGFEIICDGSFSPPKPFLGTGGLLEVVQISLPTGELRVSPINGSNSMSLDLFNRSGAVVMVSDWAIGDKTCEEARRANSSALACGDHALCYNSTNGPGYRCNCTEGFQGNPYLTDGCQDIDECLDPQLNDCDTDRVCVNYWGGYECFCSRDEPEVLRNGRVSCDIDNQRDFPVLQVTLGVGFGVLFLLIAVFCLYWALKKRRLIKLKEKFFRQNGGLLLQQQISSHDSAADVMKIFTGEELVKATDNYAESRILGRGGYGTVYKGTLPDNRVVAIKKSKLADETQVEQFINEIVILSQINHRNVVKLLGCCLETEVPLLVYEFISNGTLFHHIHEEGHVGSLSLAQRLRIAAETAGALAYLHSAASPPIFHRDVKSTNVLLDENYIAKVSDFGASRSVPFDQTHVTTLVQGTLGYLDPEYFHTSQLTDRSDVYSFGVVLVELLTGEKPVCFSRSQEERNLATHFISSMEENRLFQVLEDRVVAEGKVEHVLAISGLAKRCLSLKGEERPTMKEVEAELEGLRRLQEQEWSDQNPDEMKPLLDKPSAFEAKKDATQDSLGAHIELTSSQFLR